MSHFASGMINAGNVSVGAAPTFVSVSANGGGTTAAMPSGWAVGDLLMIFASDYRSGDVVSGHNTPAGWTELGNWTHKREGINYRTRAKIFYRIAQSGQSSVSLTVASGETPHSSCMMAFRGVDASSPFEAVETLNDQTTTTPTPPYAQIATLGSNRVVIQAISAWWGAGATNSTPYTGWTELFDSMTAVSVAVDMRTFASAGLTDAGHQTRAQSTEWGRLAFAIRPA